MKTTLIKFLLICFTTCSLALNAQTYTWTQKANFSGGVRYGGFCFSIGTKGYTGSGLTSTSITYSNDFWEYDPVTDMWTQKANFGGAVRHGASNFAIGGKGYVCNGWSSGVQLNDLWEYNPSTNTWSSKSPFPGSARYTCADFVINGKAYVGMGYAPLHNDFYCYDPSTDSWTSIAPIPGPARQSAKAFSINNFGYVIGGASSSQFLKSVYKYDPISDTWQQLSNYPGQGSYAFSAFVINNTAYAGMGSSSGAVYSDFYRYNDLTDTWTSVAAFGGGTRAAAMSIEINGKGYVGLGAKGFQSNYQLDWWEFSTCTSDPIVINGDAIACHPSQNNIYTVTPSAPGITYTWSFPSGATITSGQGSSSVSVDFANNASSGTINVVATGPCGTSTATFPLTLVCATPNTPGAVSGAKASCSRDVNTYTIQSVKNSSYYIWTPPKGAKINGSTSAFTTSDTSVVVTFTPAFNGDTIEVTAVNCQGQSKARKMRINKATPSVPVAISGITNNLCNQTGIIYSVPASNYAKFYTWRTSIPGATINGKPSPVITSSLSVVVNFGNFTTGQIFVSANSNCDQSAERSLTVYARPATPSSITGPATLCSNQQGVIYSTSAISNTLSYQWILPSNLQLSSGQGTSSITVQAGVSAPGNQLKVRAQNACASSAYQVLPVLISNCPRISDNGNTSGLSFNAYPNPAHLNLNVVIQSEESINSMISLFDITGKEIYRTEKSVTNGNNNSSIDVSGFSPGIYIIKVTNSVSGVSTSEKIIIE